MLASMVARSEPGVGDTVGHYRLDARLGEGAVGVVYRARRGSDDAVVALKLLKHRLGEDETFQARFVHEARAARHVEHDHVVPVLDAGEAGGTSYLVAEYVAGGSLADRLREEGALPIVEALRIGAEVATGLDALHRGGLVHRDVKPSNLMLYEDGRAAITDFGLAKGPAYTVLTEPGQVMGTLDYLAPELIRGEAATPSTDIYAFGCVVYECVTGSTAVRREEPVRDRNCPLEPVASRPWRDANRGDAVALVGAVEGAREGSGAATPDRHGIRVAAARRSRTALRRRSSSSPNRSGFA